MSETVDKVAKQLLASIEKSQVSGEAAVETKPAKAKARAKAKKTESVAVQNDVDVRKIVRDAMALGEESMPSRGVVTGRLRWPD